VSLALQAATMVSMRPCLAIMTRRDIGSSAFLTFGFGRRALFPSGVSGSLWLPRSRDPAIIFRSARSHLQFAYRARSRISLFSRLTRKKGCGPRRRLPGYQPTRPGARSDARSWQAAPRTPLSPPTANGQRAANRSACGKPSEEGSSRPKLLGGSSSPDSLRVASPRCGSRRLSASGET
jgi:hypothetical protein